MQDFFAKIEQSASFVKGFLRSYTQLKSNDRNKVCPANKASPPDLAIRRRKCDGGGYIVPL